MATSPNYTYSLAYFEEIFGSRTPEFRELLGILLDMLQFYHDNYPAIARRNDAQELHLFRHKHVTLVENLQLFRLKELAHQVSDLDEASRESNILEVVALTEHLMSEIKKELVG